MKLMKACLFLITLLYLSLYSCSKKLKLEQYNPLTKSIIALDGRNYSADDFKEGLCILSKDGLFGFIDSTGAILCSFKYDTIFPFYNNRAIVILDKKMGIVNKKGKEIVAPSLKFIHPFTSPTISSFQDTNTICGLIHSSGKVILKDKNFHWISPFKNGMATYASSSRVGVITDSKKRIPIYIPERIPSFIVNDIFALIHTSLTELKDLSSLSFSNGLSPIVIRMNDSIPIEQKTPLPSSEYTFLINNVPTIDSDYQHHTNWKYGFIDKKGIISISTQYYDVTAFKNGYAKVRNEQGWNLIDTNGQAIFKNNYAQLQIINEHWVIAKKGNLFGLLSFQEETIIPFDYHHLKYAFKNLFCAMGDFSARPNPITQHSTSSYSNANNSNYGVISTSLDTIMPFIYSDIHVDIEKGNYIGYAKKITETRCLPRSLCDQCHDEGYYKLFDKRGQISNKKIQFYYYYNVGRHCRRHQDNSFSPFFCSKPQK